ncbi:putative LOC100569746 [Trichonephila clavipes]|nr:putative LOC100569746 [Trichonephila clavipes]
MNFSNFDFQPTAPLLRHNESQAVSPHQGHLTLPGTINIYNMGWRLASRAICPATLSDDEPGYLNRCESAVFHNFVECVYCVFLLVPYVARVPYVANLCSKLSSEKPGSFEHSANSPQCGVRKLVESFFKNDEGHNVTVNGDRYRAMITNFFIPELNNHNVQELWFQQDGATCHTARATVDLLKDTFGDHLISRFGPVNWPPRSCDLTPLDYFLWDYVKSLVYADKPQMLDHLEDNIHRVIADIRPQMLEKVIENWTSRLDYIRASRGSPMPEIIFKMPQDYL